VPFERRLRNGIRAYFEHLPVPRFRGDRRRVYRGLRLGRHAELLLMDLHGYGDDYVCGFQIPPQPCPEADDPSLTMLGPRQKAWVKRRLAASRATWKLLGSTVMMMSLDVAPGTSFNPGQWDGFTAERRELMQHCLDNDIGGVAVISGDIHTFFAGEVTTTGRSTGTAAASEFVGGAISSEGINQGVAEAMGLPEDTDVSVIAGLLAGVNPHYEYLNTARRGYGVLECRADELRVKFRSPQSVLVPNSPVETLAEFRVEPDSPQVEQL
jgi:phosphodiesterase/alkaline phosphatase D-like protein